MSVWVVLSQVGACASVDIAGTTALPTVPETHGTDLGEAGRLVLAWSPAYDQLLFVSPDWRTARAFTVSSGSTRDLATVSGEQTVDVSPSFDGQEAFTTDIALTGERHRTSRRHSSAGTTDLTPHALYNGAYSRADGSSVLVSPTQALAVFLAEPDSAFLLRRGEAPVFVGSGCLAAVAFSPDESRVLCRTAPNNESYALMRLADGVQEPIALPSDISRYARLFRWDGGGIRVLYSSGWDIRLHDVATGTSRAFLRAGTFDEFSDGRSLSWSADGRKVAYSTTRCAASTGLLGCKSFQGVAYVYDVTSGSTTVAAAHTLAAGSSGVDQVAISRGGEQLAYVVNGHLYLVALH